MMFFFVALDLFVSLGDVLFFADWDAMGFIAMFHHHLGDIFFKLFPTTEQANPKEVVQFFDPSKLDGD